MKLNYYLLDVFTNRKLAGNPLAVVLKADGLTDSRMQAIAAEFNLSETVFVRSPQDEKLNAALRIFTPKVELPFAGHPTVGAAVLLGLLNNLSAVRMELHVGLVTAVMDKVDKKRGTSRFALPVLPKEIGAAPTADKIASTLGIAPEEIGCGPYQPAYFSAGTPFYLVPVRGSDVLRKIKLERRGWSEVYPEGRHSVYVYTMTPEEKENDIAARMFAPGLGLGEDAATGSAAAALIGKLAEHYDDGLHQIKLRQGVEMGRPSQISLQFKKENGVLKHAGIGGMAIIVAEGVLDLSE